MGREMSLFKCVVGGGGIFLYHIEYFALAKNLVTTFCVLLDLLTKKSDRGNIIYSLLACG